MYLKYIKDHPVGIAKGTFSINGKLHGLNLIENGYAEEVAKKEHDEFLVKRKKERDLKASEILTKQLEAIEKDKEDSILANKKAKEDADRLISDAEKTRTKKDFERFAPLVAEMIAESKEEEELVVDEKKI